MQRAPHMCIETNRIYTTPGKLLDCTKLNAVYCCCAAKYVHVNYCATCVIRNILNCYLLQICLHYIYAVDYIYAEFEPRQVLTFIEIMHTNSVQYILKFNVASKILSEKN